MQKIEAKETLEVFLKLKAAGRTGRLLISGCSQTKALHDRGMAMLSNSALLAQPDAEDRQTS